MSDGSIVISTKIDSSGAEKDAGNLGSKLSGSAKTGLKVFTGAIAAAGTAIGGLAGVATKYNSQMEDYFANFTVLLGSTTEATKHVEDLKEFAAKTPFEMAGLADASKQLLSFGFDADDVMPSLQMLGDISLGNQERFKGLSLVFAQVASQGKLTGQDLMQFINQGFNPLQAIAEKTGKSMADLREEMSDGKISYEMVADAMKTATSEGGKFYKGMEVQSQTLSGQWSTLKDDTMSLLGDAFKPFSETLKTDVMPALQEIVKKMGEAFADPNIQSSISNIASGLGDLAVKLGEIISKWLPKIIDGFSWILDNSGTIAAGIIGIGVALLTLKIASIVGMIAEKFKLLYSEIAAGTPIMKAFNIVLGMNPYVLIVAAVVGLVAAFIYLWNTSEGFRSFFINMWEGIKTGFILAWNAIMGFFTETIPAWIESIKAWFASFGEWFGELWNNIKQFFIDGWNSIVSFFTESIPTWWANVKQSFVDGWNAIVAFFTETVPALIESIFNWFSELPYKIGYALGYALGTVAQWGIDIWTYLSTNVPIWISSIGTWFSELPGRIWTWLVETFNKVVTWGSNTWNNFIETCSNIYNSVTEWFSKLPGLIWNWLVIAYNKVVAWGQNIWNSMSSAASNAINAVVNWFKELPGRMWSWLTNAISKVAQFARDLGSKASEAGSNMVSNIINAVKNLPSEMASIGGNIVRGVWNGIVGMGSWLADKVKNFFTGIVDGAKSALGIASPSRVFRDQVGKYMAQGVGVGFEDETKNVKADMDKNLEDLVYTMQSTVDVETAKTTVAVAAETSRYVNNDNANTDKKNNSVPNVENKHFYVSGKEFMEVLAPYADDVLEAWRDGR